MEESLNRCYPRSSDQQQALIERREFDRLGRTFEAGDRSGLWRRRANWGTKNFRIFCRQPFEARFGSGFFRWRIGMPRVDGVEQDLGRGPGCNRIGDSRDQCIRGLLIGEPNR